MDAVYHAVFTDYPDVLNIPQVSKMLGVCDKTTYKLIATGSLPVIKVGRLYRVTKVSVLNYIHLMQPHTGTNN